MICSSTMHTRLCTFLNLTAKGYVELSNSVNRCRRLHSYRATKTTAFALIPSQILQYSSDCPPKCWNCSYPHKSELFCSKCKTLQKPPKNLNYFDIIGVKEDYNVESAEIQRKYRQLQNMLHPDRFGNKSTASTEILISRVIRIKFNNIYTKRKSDNDYSTFLLNVEKEKEISEHLSSLINKAYSTLMHPLDRGLYLLRLNNLTIPEGTTSLNPEFLMEIMERNEEVERASNNKEEVVKLMKENREILDKLSKDVSDAFRNKDNEKAKIILVKMKYYASIDARLKELKQQLGIVD